MKLENMTRTEILSNILSGIDIDELQAIEPTGYSLLIKVLEGIVQGLGIEEVRERAYIYEYYLETGDIDQPYS